MDAQYELNRVTDVPSFAKKMARKRLLDRLVGEVYIGRRVKRVYFRRWLRRIPIPEGAQIMEAGSGDGSFSFFIARNLKRASVLGLELNPIEAEVCQMFAQKERVPNLRFEAGDLADSQWRERFDFVFCLDVLEHIADDTSTMRQLFSALKAGGSLLVHVPNRFFMETDGRLLTVPDEDAWKINPGHARHGYTSEEIDGKLQQAGFDVRRVEQTQGRAITYAHRLYRKVEKALLLRVLILPIIDILTWADTRKAPAHGNTVWAWAQKPA